MNMENHKKSFVFYIILLLLVVMISGLVGGVVGFMSGAFSQKIITKVQYPLIRSFFSLSDTQAINQEITVTEDSATIDVVKKVSPAVVSVVVTKDLSALQQNQFPFNDFFFGFPFNFQVPQLPEGKQEIGGGTGFIIDANKGLIVTNRHVVDDIEAEYSIITNDGNTYKAQVLARDTFNDLAVLQVEVENLTAVELGDSDQLQIGQTVIAIGNALGEYSNTVTRGVVSGKGRTIIAGSYSGSEKLEDVIQTDAAINPGNSGGPLLNLSGQVIGINTAIDRQGQLVGFAIPINNVKKVIESVEKEGRIVRPYLGVRYILLNKEIAEKNNLEIDYGALIVRGDTRTDLAVVPGSPADKAGLRENDIILEVGGKKISEKDSLSELIQVYQVDETIILKIMRQGEEKDVEVILSEYKN